MSAICRQTARCRAHKGEDGKPACCPVFDSVSALDEAGHTHIYIYRFIYIYSITSPQELAPVKV